MFQGIKFKNSLKKHGYYLKPSPYVAMCYEIFDSNNKKNKLSVFQSKEGRWYCSHEPKNNPSMQAYYPEEAVLYKLGLPFV